MVTDQSGKIHGSDGKFTGAVTSTAAATLEPDDAASGYDDGWYGQVQDRAERTEAMKADLEDAVTDLVRSGKLTDYLDAMSANRMRHWSASNQLLATLQVCHREGINDPDAMFARMRSMDCGTAKQWRERGRHITSGKGSALYILAPSTRTITEDDPDRPGQQRKRTIVVGFRPSATFDVTQTDGEPVPAHPSTAFSGQVADGTVDGIRSRIHQLGYTYEESEIPGTDVDHLSGTLAYVEPESKRVVVDSRLPAGQKAASLAHELGHIECGHVDADQAEYQKHRGSMETEAEAFSYLLMRSRGADARDAEAFSPGYIGGWSKGDPALVTKAVNNAGKAFNRADEQIDWLHH